MAYFYDTSEVKRREMAPGVNLRTMWGDKIMMSLVEIAPEAVVPTHSHPHEQAGMVIQGEFDFTIGGETRAGQAGRQLRDSGRRRARGRRIVGVVAGPGHLQPASGGLQVVGPVAGPKWEACCPQSLQGPPSQSPPARGRGKLEPPYEGGDVGRAHLERRGNSRGEHLVPSPRGGRLGWGAALPATFERRAGPQADRSATPSSVLTPKFVA